MILKTLSEKYPDRERSWNSSQINICTKTLGKYLIWSIQTTHLETDCQSKQRIIKRRQEIHNSEKQSNLSKTLSSEYPVKDYTYISISKVPLINSL